MPRSKHALLVPALAAVLFAAGAAVAADGRSVYLRCVACHGVAAEGVASTGAPPLAGLHAAYLQRQLQSFASGARGAKPGDKYGTSMRSAGAPLLSSDTERAAVAAYLSALKPGAQRTPGRTTANGRNYFNAVCGACHGSGGEGNPALGAPRLAGLPEAYLARQFAAFQSGQRGYQPDDRYGIQMRTITTMLPDAATVRDVIAYAASLRP